MISAYVLQAWAFNVIHLLTEEKLIEIKPEMTTTPIQTLPVS